MSKELRISAAIKLPDDEFAAAEMLVKHRPAIDALREALGVDVTAEVVSARVAAKKLAAPAVRAVA